MPHPRTASSAPIQTDVLIIGAGPGGLYALFQLGLLGLDAQLIDALPEIGGQCQALYADKPIYDIPALAPITGQDLADQLLAQAAQIQAYAPIEQRLHLGQLVSGLSQADDGRWLISSEQGKVFSARAVLLAAGVGAFVPRRLKLPHLDAISNCLHYHPGQLEDFAGQHVCIVGEDDIALQWACDLAESGLAQRVTLNHRRAQLSASAAVQARLQALIAAGRLDFVPGIVQGLEHSQGAAGGQLHSLQLLQSDGSPRSLPCTRLGMLLGLAPQMGPLVDWGLALERRQLAVNSASMACNLPGIFAIGDAIHYPGKLKLIACAFHEATLAAHAALAYCYPERVTPLQYTSSSALLQARLGQSGT